MNWNNLQSTNQTLKPLFLKPEQVASLLQFNVRTIHEYCKTGRIPARQVGRYWRIPTAYVESMLGAGVN